MPQRLLAISTALEEFLTTPPPQKKKKNRAQPKGEEKFDRECISFGGEIEKRILSSKTPPPHQRLG